MVRAYQNMRNKLVFVIYYRAKRIGDEIQYIPYMTNGIIDVRVNELRKLYLREIPMSDAKATEILIGKNHTIKKIGEPMKMNDLYICNNAIFTVGKSYMLTDESMKALNLYYRCRLETACPIIPKSRLDFGYTANGGKNYEQLKLGTA